MCIKQWARVLPSKCNRRKLARWGGNILGKVRTLGLRILKNHSSGQIGLTNQKMKHAKMWPVYPLAYMYKCIITADSTTFVFPLLSATRTKTKKLSRHDWDPSPVTTLITEQQQSSWISDMINKFLHFINLVWSGSSLSICVCQQRAELWTCACCNMKFGENSRKSRKFYPSTFNLSTCWQSEGRIGTVRITVGVVFCGWNIFGTLKCA